MHTQVVETICTTLAENTTEGRMSIVCIVPVSGAYQKGSVRDPCILQAQRWILANAFKDSVTPNLIVDVHLLDYEFISPTAVATVDSMETLKQTYPNADTYFLAQGQDNILAILQHKWKRSDELLNYKFLMFPRGEEQPEITAAIASEQILNIGGDFNDDTSSSKVRELIRKGEDYTSLLHPTVAAALAEMEPMPYKDQSCEVKPAAGGARSSPSNRMTSNHKYESTVKGTMAWANSELEHVGRIASIKDKDLQYSYALSTVNGMAHLRDALYQLVKDPNYRAHSMDLLRTHDAVIRVMKHLIREYKVNLDTIRMFNTRKVLTDFSYLKNAKGKATRKANKSRRGTRRSHS
jgi:nicotinic acid mononucleotide adenylyltransferase